MMTPRIDSMIRGAAVLFLASSLTLSSLAIQAQEGDPPCDLLLNAEMSLTEAIEASDPGDLICLGVGTWQESISISKSITIRGEGSNSSILLGLRSEPNVVQIDRDNEIEVVLVGLSIQGSVLDGTGVSISGNALVNITSVLVENNGIGISVLDNAVLFLTSSSILNNQAVSDASGNDGDLFPGLLAGGASVVEIDDSGIERSGSMGVLVVETAMLKFANSLSSENVIGLAVTDQADLFIDDSRIIQNEEQGVGYLGEATGVIQNSVIEENGTATKCQFEGSEPGGEICNGVFFAGAPETIIRDSAIRNNTDWGVAGSNRACGYNADQFFGIVRFEESNLIVANNLSGNQDGDGNPGSHIYQTSSDGQVCVN